MILLNRNAVRGRRLRRAHARLRAWIPTSGLDAQVLETRDAKTARGHAGEAGRRGVEAVVAAGGDGTVQSVAAGLLEVGADAGDRPALVVAPLGRGNDLARSLGVAPGIEGALDALTAGSDRALDVGRAEIDGVAQVFVNALGIGLDAAIARRARRLRLPGGVPYRIAAVVTILRERGPWRIAGTIDDDPIERDVTLLHLGNGATTGGGFRLTPDARTGDGLLDSCTYLETKRRRILALLPRAARGDHLGRPGVDTGRLARLDLGIDPPAPVHGDGEAFSDGARAVRVRVHAGALRVRLPSP